MDNDQGIAAVKAVILAGGYGTRISEETDLIPKPMIEIGGRPILWHIMKIYSHWGINEFIICLGYKGYMIKEYFANYFLHVSDVTFDIKNNSMQVHRHAAEPWKVTLVDTGLGTMTGGRLKRIRPYVGDETFCMTYGDGLEQRRHQGPGGVSSIARQARNGDGDQPAGPLRRAAYRTRRRPRVSARSRRRRKP